MSSHSFDSIGVGYFVALQHVIRLGPATGAVHAYLVLQALVPPFGAASACMSPVGRPRPAAPFQVLALPLSPFGPWVVSSLAASGVSAVSTAVAMFPVPGRC